MAEITSNQKALKQQFASEIRRVMSERQVNCFELQIRTGLAKVTIYRVRNGFDGTTLDTLQRVADALGITWEVTGNVSES